MLGCCPKLDGEPQPPVPPFDDAPTTAWVQGDAVINELRLRGDEFLAARETAFQRVLSRELAETSGDGSTEADEILARLGVTRTPEVPLP